MGVARILFLADTHLGFDMPFRPRVERRRRGDDFFANYQRALEPARRGEVDFVVHGGDLLFRSRVPPALVDMAFGPLRRVAEGGVPVLLVPGNHERSKIPFPLLSRHPRIHVFHEARTFVCGADGLRVAFAGFPYVREGVRDRFGEVLARTRYREVGADVNVVCMHHCFEGSTCGPGNFTFRHGPDVVRARDLPGDVAVVLSGHIHRQQVLTEDLRGVRLRAPVLYAGSVERTSFAEMDEVKGYLIVDIGTEARNGGRGVSWSFRRLAARPMESREIRASGEGFDGVDAQVRTAIRSVSPDAVLQLRIRGDLSHGAAVALGTARLRALAPPTMNLCISHPRRTRGLRYVRGDQPLGRPHDLRNHADSARDADREGLPDRPSPRLGRDGSRLPGA